MDTLDEVLEFLGTIPTINEGGCGIAALSVWKWAEKNCPKELDNISIVYLYENEEYNLLLQNKSAIVCDDLDLIFVPPHVAILWEDVILESGGGEVTEYKLYDEVPINFLEKSLKQFWKWSGIFSRFQWIPVIEKELGIDLQEFLIENLPTRIVL